MVTTGAQRAPPADTVSASRAAQASEARLYIQSTPLNRVTSVRGHFGPIQAENPINRKYFVLASMCKSYSGPTKSGPIKRLTQLNSGPIKRVDCIYIRI